MLMPGIDGVSSNAFDTSSTYWMLVDTKSPLEVKNVAIRRSINESLQLLPYTVWVLQANGLYDAFRKLKRKPSLYCMQEIKMRIIIHEDFNKKVAIYYQLES